MSVYNTSNTFTPVVVISTSPKVFADEGLTCLTVVEKVAMDVTY